MAAPPAGFLAERLAKASAVPAEQRSADVRAFIETCALQAELAEELGLPEDFSGTLLEWRECWGRWSTAAALKLARSHFVSPSSFFLLHAPQVHDFATYNLYVRTSWGRTGTFPSDLGRELAGLLGDDPGLHAFAILAAGLPGAMRGRGWERGEIHGDELHGGGGPLGESLSPTLLPSNLAAQGSCSCPSSRWNSCSGHTCGPGCRASWPRCRSS